MHSFTSFTSNCLYQLDANVAAIIYLKNGLKLIMYMLTLKIYEKLSFACNVDKSSQNRKVRTAVGILRFKLKSGLSNRLLATLVDF